MDTNDRIRSRTRKRLTEVRETNQEVMENASFSGKAGQFVGAMGSAFLDPIYLPTYFIGVGSAAQSTRILSAMAKAAGTAAVTEGGVEAIKQVAMNDWKQEIGADHSLESALQRIMFSAGFGGSIAGMSAAAAHVTLHTFGKKAFKDLEMNPEDMIFKPYQDHVEDLEIVNQALGPEATTTSYLDSQKRIENKIAEINGRKVKDDLELTPETLAEDAEIDRVYQNMTKENPEMEGFTEKYLDEEGTPEVKRVTDIIEETQDDINLLEEGLECLLAGV